MYHLLRLNKGNDVLQRAVTLAGIDVEALNNFVNRTLSKLEASDDEETD